MGRGPARLSRVLAWAQERALRHMRRRNVAPTIEGLLGDLFNF